MELETPERDSIVFQYWKHIAKRKGRQGGGGGGRSHRLCPVRSFKDTEEKGTGKEKTWFRLAATMAL